MGLVRLRLKWVVLCICAVISKTSFGQVMPDEIKESQNHYNEWGILAGGNFQQIVAYPFKPTYSQGAVLGVYGKRRKQAFSYQYGLSLNSSRFETELPLAHQYKKPYIKYADTVSKGVFDAVNISIPVVAEIRFRKRLTLRMGAAYSYLIYINDNNGAYAKVGDEKKLLKPSNVSGTAGFEFDITKKLKIGASYYFGVLDINNGKFQGLTDKWSTNNATITLAYRIKKWYPKSGRGN